MAEKSTTLTQLPQEDFAAIENAVMETERGRWFLKEYAARNRHAETDKLLEAITRIESAVTEKAEEVQKAADADAETVSSAGDKIKFDLLDMMTAISETRREIAAIGSEDENNSHIGSATLELDAIVESTEKATSQILESAEKIQEHAWTLREEGLDDEHCDQLDTLTTDIYMACSFQDITGQRTQKVVQVLRYLENRLESMASIWADESVATPDTPKSDIDFKSEVDSRPDAHLLNGPQLEGEAADQDDVDLMFVDTEDLDAAAEMECMLEASETEESVQENTDQATDANAEPDLSVGETHEEIAEETSEADACTETGVDDELIIVKQDTSSAMDEEGSAASLETSAVSQEAEAEHAANDIEAAAPSQENEAEFELSESDNQALFSTHEA